MYTHTTAFHVNTTATQRDKTAGKRLTVDDSTAVINCLSRLNIRGARNIAQQQLPLFSVGSAALSSHTLV